MLHAIPPKKVSVPCPVCDSTRRQAVYRPWREIADPQALYGATNPVQGCQTLVRCTDCGILYESPRYRADVIIGAYATADSVHDSQHSVRARSFYRALTKLSRHLPAPGAKVLDVGTAGGAFLAAATQFGYDAYGLEPSEHLAQRGRARGLKIQQGTLACHDFERHSFDMVCLWDVLEHLPDPKAALLTIRQLLKPDGLLLVNFPDISTWQAKLAGARFWWIISVHLQHFTPKSFADICERTGFNAFCCAPYWQTLEFGYLQRMAARYGVPLSGLLAKVTPQFIQRLPIPYFASQTTGLARVAR